MIFVARQIQEKGLEQTQELIMAFIDLTNAFNVISREALWKVVITILRLLHDKMAATVLFNGTETENFTIRTGVKQGCVITPTLFTVSYAPSFVSLVTDFSMALNLTTGLMLEAI